jgi:hypothetical protein
VAVRVTGLEETVRAFRKLDRSLGREMQTELKKVAKPVMRSGQSKIGQYQGASVSTIGVRASGASVFVTQRAKKVTGKRGDFGRLQVGLLEESLDENEREVINGIEDFLDRFTSKEGF